VAERLGLAETGGARVDAPAVLAEARRVLRLEAEALEQAAARLDESFVAAISALRDASGRVIVSGLGKSGVIARKIAATLTSTGTPAWFLHPVEGLHGDLGMVGRDDVAILLSKSGESTELTALVEHLTRFGVPIIALTGRPQSSLARAARAVIDCSVREEACPYDLAPTSSTTVALAMGDALAVALLHERRFTREDFARLHPGGALGRRLTLRVRDLMLTERLPLLSPAATMRECVVLLAEKRGTVAVVDSHDRLVGVVTAGDLTRMMEHEERVFRVLVSEVMTQDPKRIEPDALAAAAVFQMERHGIMAMPVVDADQRVIGMVHLHDLLRAGVV
jgi:arabinose-5-phosphate isomerase